MLSAESWPDGAMLAVRVGVHTGEATERDGDYVGTTVNRAARIRSVCEGGEVLMSAATADWSPTTSPWTRRWSIWAMFGCGG